LEDRFYGILVAFILITLFGYLILSSVTTVGTTYEMDVDDVVGGSLNVNSFYGNSSEVRGAFEVFQDRFNAGNIWSAIAGIVVNGIFGIAKDMITMITFPFALISNIMVDIFEVPSIVTDVILGLLILGILFGIWRLLKVGD